MKEKAEELISRSTLSDEDKQVWRGIIEQLSDDERSFFVDIITAKPELLEPITQNVKRKFEAGDNEEKIAKVVEEERNTLKTLL